MKYNYITLLFFIILANTFGQNNSENFTTGKLKFEFIKDKIIVPVFINGNEYKFLLDTGGIFEVSQSLQDKFKFTKLEPITIVGINRNEIEIETVKVPEINIGNWSIKNRRAIVSDLHSKYPYSCFELDGMIGRDFFEDVILQIDLASNSIQITNDEKKFDFNKDYKTKLKISKRGLPEVKLKINGKNKYIEFDSGSGDFYSPMTSDVEKMLKKGNPDILSFYGEFSFGIAMDNVKYTYRYKEKLDELELAGLNFKDFYSQFSKVSSPRIGASILKYGKVTLDYKSNSFYYEPYNENQNVKPFKSFGFDISIEDGFYVVKYIMKGSKADILGLRPGSKILKIDELSTVNISEDCQGYLNRYSFENKDKIKITFLKSNGSEKTIELTKQTYL